MRAVLSACATSSVLQRKADGSRYYPSPWPSPTGFLAWSFLTLAG